MWIVVTQKLSYTSYQTHQRWYNPPKILKLRFDYGQQIFLSHQAGIPKERQLISKKVTKNIGKGKEKYAGARETGKMGLAHTSLKSSFF